MTDPVTSTDPVWAARQAREQALEEAAEVAEIRMNRAAHQRVLAEHVRRYSDVIRLGGEEDASASISLAIRALKDQP